MKSLGTFLNNFHGAIKDYIGQPQKKKTFKVECIQILTMQPSKPHPSPIQEKKHYPHKYPHVKSNSLKAKEKTDCTLITPKAESY